MRETTMRFLVKLWIILPIGELDEDMVEQYDEKMREEVDELDGPDWLTLSFEAKWDCEESGVGIYFREGVVWIYEGDFESWFNNTVVPQVNFNYPKASIRMEALNLDKPSDFNLIWNPKYQPSTSSFQMF